ncbi:MAG: rhomboid family intramembrane serine protease [Bacteroides sp.]
MQQLRSVFAQSPVVANLILINVVLLVATWVGESTLHVDLVDVLGLHYPESKAFRPYQIVTHLFMHGGVTHLFFNMFALWMFGRILEQELGNKRFFFYYFFTGLGAAAVHTFVNYVEFSLLKEQVASLLNDLNPDSLDYFVTRHFAPYHAYFYDNIIAPWSAAPQNVLYAEQAREALQQVVQLQMSIPTVGASGAVFGILLAFGMLFPNVTLYLLIPPIPLKAKWFVLIYAAIEIYLGFSQPGSNIAHFAHVGGMLFGFFLILYWKRHGRS